MKRILRTAFLSAMLVAASRTWAAEPLTFTITECLDEDWNQERVSFPVSLHEDLHLRRLAVRDADGRTADAQFVPDAPGSRTGRIYFIVDLRPHEKQTWTLVQDAGVSHTDRPGVRHRDSFVEFGNRRIAVRCPFGRQAWPEGIPASQAPAPVLAVRLSNGDWVGAGRMGSPLRVTSLTGDLVVSGPVFARLRLTYTFAGNRRYVAELECLAGQEVVLVSEESNLDPGASFLRNVKPAGAPEGNFIMSAFGPELEARGSYWSLLLDENAAPDRLAWQPQARVWDNKTLAGEPRWTFPRPNTPGPVVTLNPHHGEWWLNVSKWAGVFSTKSSGFLALLALHAGQWQNAHENVIVIDNDEHNRLRALLPINNGARRWALFTAPRDEAIDYPASWAQGLPDPDIHPGERYPATIPARPAQRATIKYGYLPLDMVKDWILEFDDPPGIVFPHIFARAAELSAIRQHIAKTPALKEEVARLKTVWDAYKTTKDPAYPY